MIGMLWKFTQIHKSAPLQYVIRLSLSVLILKGCIRIGDCVLKDDRSTLLKGFHLCCFSLYTYKAPHGLQLRDLVFKKELRLRCQFPSIRAYKKSARMLPASKSSILCNDRMFMPYTIYLSLIHKANLRGEGPQRARTVTRKLNTTAQLNNQLAYPYIPRVWRHPI